MGALSKFPEEGVCWTITDELLEFLKKGRNCQYTWSNKYKGIAWGPLNYYGVQGHSSRPIYTIEQLNPFLNKEKCSVPEKISHFLNKGYTVDDFVIGQYYYCHWDEYFAIIKYDSKRDKERLAGPRISNSPVLCFQRDLYVPERQFRIASQEERDWLNACISAGKLVDRQVTARPTLDFPEKWAIMVTEENKCLLQEFMVRKSYMWLEYRNTWRVEPGDISKPNYFHFPPVDLSPSHSRWKIENGYSSIDTEDLKKHVLTNNQLIKLKEDGKSETIKVQGPDISIRGGEPIRAIGIRCPKVQIEVRDGNCPDEIRSVRG